MFKSIDGFIEKDGGIHLKEPIRLKRRCRVIVTIIDADQDANTIGEAALLSEPALAEDWDREEEDEAWSHLQ